MQKNITKNIKFNLFKTKNYWRNLDKSLFLCFIILFLLGLFFSFSSTSFIADEKLNKDYYFFFQKHLIYTLVSFIVMISLSMLNTKFLNITLLEIFKLLHNSSNFILSFPSPIIINL